MRSTTIRPGEAHAGTATLNRSTRWALVSLALSMLLSSLGTSIANVGLPALAHAFAASFQAVQWVVLAYLLAITTLIVGAGRLGDLVGRRRLLLAGIAVFTLASVLCAIAPTLTLLVAARAIQGLGAAVMMALTMALVAETVPKDRTGSAMGLLGTMSAIGTALGPSLGGVLIAWLGWRAIFVVNLPLGMLTLFLARRHLPADRRTTSASAEQVDPAGTLLLALALGAYALAMTIGRGRIGLFNVGLLCAAILFAGFFIRAEARAAAPLIRLSMLRDRGLSASLVMSLLVCTVMMSTLVVGPFYLARGLGLAAAPVGLAMSLGPIVSALSGVPAGRLADRFGTRPTTVAGLAAMTLGASAMVMTRVSMGIAGYLVPIAILTVGYALFQTANNAAVMADVRVEARGLVSGLLSLSRNLGLVTGASVMGAIFAWASASGDMGTAAAEAVASGMRSTFVVSAVLVAVALGLALVAGRRTTA